MSDMTSPDVATGDTTPAVQATVTSRRGIDPAALATACLATVVSTLISAGPYGPLSIPIGVTILVLLLAYDVDPERNGWQSLAYGAAIGLVIALTLGFPLEIGFALKKGDALTNALMGTASAVAPTQAANATAESNVPPYAILVVWAIATLFVCWLDRRRKRPTR